MANPRPDKFFVYADPNGRLIAVQRHPDAIDRAQTLELKSRLFEGHPVSEEVMRKMLLLQGGRVVGPNTIEDIGNWQFGAAYETARHKTTGSNDDAASRTDRHAVVNFAYNE